MNQKTRLFFSCLVISLVTLSQNIYAADRIIDLVIGYKKVSFAGKEQTAISVNNEIPAPILKFKQGDHVQINVHNLLDSETSIHWHGIILPWQMDGVLGISQQGIPPGGVFHYQFTLNQAGTYWYHAHARLQEQEGLYGAFIISPRTPSKYHVDKDYSVVLSDWSNTPPEQILSNLKKSGDYYSSKFPLQPSLLKFLHDYNRASKKERELLLSDYKMMQLMRMSIYDFSDVAYDAYLLNGHSLSSPWKAVVKVGDLVRLRFIGAAGSTIYRVKIPGATLKIIHVQGNDVRPYNVSNFTIAPGETVDVLVKIQNKSPTIIYAESNDTLGSAVGALVTNPNQVINIQSIQHFPEPLPVSRTMMHTMMGGMSHDMPMAMDMPTESTIVGDTLCPNDALYKSTKNTQYQKIVAKDKTNDPNKNVDRVIKMELFGYMDHFIWFINGVPEYNAKPIIFEQGKRYRFVFINTSMMSHPMHFHGHWFIFRNGHGAYDPLLHTINVPPGATITADVDGDVSGQWLFHCHLLYHMMSGMSRVFQYSTLLDVVHNKVEPQNSIKLSNYVNRPIVHVDAVRPININLVNHPMAHLMKRNYATNIDVGVDPFRKVLKLDLKGLYGYDYHKLELYANDAEINNGKIENADLDLFYWHLMYQFWAIKGGVNYTVKPANKPYLQPGVGIEGMMPYFIEADLRAYYHAGNLKFDLELSRDTQITNNFFLHTAVRSIVETRESNQMRYIIRPYYRVKPGMDIFVEYERERDYGHSSVKSTVTGGVSLLL
ncbi:MAG: multicopper oxidase domain-containing protein [Gammaproteobacteria bacterium]|nr:multicopper oxidase domain-containing protein [Gammaproteobacteria bacterium]